jgi:hypothetical protein
VVAGPATHMTCSSRTRSGRPTSPGWNAPRSSLTTPRWSEVPAVRSTLGYGASSPPTSP